MTTMLSLALLLGFMLATVTAHWRVRRHDDAPTVLDRWRAVLAKPCEEDARVGHRRVCDGAEDRHAILVPRLLIAYGTYRTWLAREAEGLDEHATLIAE